MVDTDQMKYLLQTYEKPLLQMGDSLDLANLKLKVEEIEAIMKETGFWDSVETSQRYVKELKIAKDTIESYENLKKTYDELFVLIDMAVEENDEQMVPEIRVETDAFVDKFATMRLNTLLSGPYDKEDAILTLHAGAGGTESNDWAAMLCRMYLKYADKSGYKAEMLDFLDGDEAGYKSVTLQVSGENAYGHLRGEHGVHRLVRMSPFNAQGKRQTSFVSCDVMPDIKTNIDIEVEEKDLRVDTYHASGAGGQHINKTSSAVRLTHLPTGIVVACQNERSQFQNKDKAMELLKAKLFLLRQSENEANVAGIRGEVRDINFGNQIRSYVLAPYMMVKDHRTDYEAGDANKVLDGNLDPFIEAYLSWNVTGKNSNEN
jgi:peptide chain release factor 2